MSQRPRAELLEEELLLVRHSGEIPEVALHGSLYYLCTDEEGPRLCLGPEELRTLEEAALNRYREIILRDLDVANRDLRLFRGIRRANHNWYRFVRFSDRIGASYGEFRLQTGAALLHYLSHELQEVGAGQRRPSLNCTADALQTFVLALGLEIADLPEGWAQLCEQEPLT